MAICRGCGAEVGCGCSLTNGLCAGCINKGIKRLMKLWKAFF